MSAFDTKQFSEAIDPAVRIALRHAYDLGHERGAADMRERAAQLASTKWGDIDELIAAIRALPLTAPSAGVPPTEPSGAPTEYSDEDSEEFG